MVMFVKLLNKDMEEKKRKFEIFKRIIKKEWKGKNNVYEWNGMGWREDMIREDRR